VEAEQERHATILSLLLNNSNVFLTQTSSFDNSQVTKDGAFMIRTVLANNSEISEEICPMAILKTGFDFGKIVELVSSNINTKSWKPSSTSSDEDPRRIFTKTEILTWKLTNALFDPLPKLGKGPYPNFAKDAIQEALVKERFSLWLKECVSSIPLSSSSMGSAESIFHLLTKRTISKAVKEAIKNGDHRLATIIAQCGGPGSHVSVRSEIPGGSGKSVSWGHGVPGRGETFESVREDLSAQVSIWTKLESNGGVSKEYINVFKLLSGNIDFWDKNFVGSVKDWKSTLGLYYWYGHGGGVTIGESVEAFEASFGSGKGKYPLPAYLERKGVITESSKSYPKDICYHLIKIFVDSGYLLHDALDPKSSTSNNLDYRKVISSMFFWKN
jgi:nuclear pore complex protein Nup98-Nup96